MLFRLEAFARSRHGSLTVIGALALTATVATAALAIDTAHVFVERRRAQGATDLAALAAAQDLANAGQAAAASLAANGYPVATAHQVVLGRYEPDPEQAAHARFTPGATPHNAAAVRLQSRASLFFGRAIVRNDTVATETSAVAVNTRLAAFSIASRLARLEGGVLNQLLGALTGSEIALTAMDYRALLDAKVDLFRSLDAIAIEGGLTGLTYGDLLESDIEAGDLLDGIAGVLEIDGERDAASALREVARLAGDAAIPLADAFGLGPYADLAVGEAPDLEVQVGAFDLLAAAARLASGDTMVEIDTGLTIPGIASLTAKLAIGEPEQATPWLAVGAAGTTVTTAQTRLLLEAKLGGSGLLALATIRVPLYLEVAAGIARLSSIECGWDHRNDTGVTLEAKPGIASLWLGHIDPDDLPRFGTEVTPSRATLVSVTLATVRGLTHVESGNLDWTPVAFSLSDIEAGAVKTVATHDYAGSLVSALFDDLELDVSVGPLSLGLGGIVEGLVGAILETAANPLDDVLANLLAGLGLSLGEVDLRVGGVRCDGAALVS